MKVENKKRERKKNVLKRQDGTGYANIPAKVENA